MVGVRVVQGSLVASTRLWVGVDWRMAGRDRAGTFTNPYEKQLTRSTVGELSVVGRFALPGAGADNAFAWFATLGNDAYACTHWGDVAKFDLTSRALRWQFDFDNPNETQMCSGDGGPYLAADGSVWLGNTRFDGATGDYTYGEHRTDVTTPAGDILIGSGTQFAGYSPVGIDPTSGAFLWHAEGGTRLTALSTGAVYAGDTGSLYRINPQTGATMWSKSYEPGIGALESNSKVLITQMWRPFSEGGVDLAKLDLDTGEPVWRFDISMGWSSMVTVDAERAYVIRSIKSWFDDNLTAIDLSGQEVWTVALPTGEVFPDTRITQANGILYVPMRGSLRTYDAATGTHLSTTPLRDPAGRKVIPGTAIVDDGHVYVTSTTGVYDLALD